MPLANDRLCQPQRPGSDGKNNSGEGRGRGDGDERRAEGRSEGTGTSEGPREGAREGAREEDERRGAEWKFDVYKQRVKATKPTVRRLLYRLAFVAAVPNSAC